MDDDAEEVAKQELTEQLQFLDEHDAKRPALAKRVEESLRDLAKARGCTFIRIESFRDELRRDGELKEQASGSA